MAKSKTVFLCTECGSTQRRWLGRCPDCGSWDTIKEEKLAPVEVSGPLARIPGAEPARAVPICEVEPNPEERIATGIGELDRVLGEGLVPGSGVLIAGEPGIGKSTLLLQCAQSVAATERPFLYVTGEESAAQVKLRADRLGDSAPELLLLAECDLSVIEGEILDRKPAVVGIDSVQTLRWHELPSSAGGVIQVREVTARLLTLARGLGFPLILIGHVTKDGNVAGPRLLEHMVDAVLSFEGERSHDLRILRGVKNRFGSTQEVGIFEMHAGGLREVSNPSSLLLGDHRTAAVGSATAAVLEGSRPLLVEMQALVSPSAYGSPARKVSGLDPGRLSMLAAVLEKRLGIPLGDRDIFANVVGGVRLTGTSADLALAAALLSSIHERAIPPDRVFAGEVGLLGEVRAVPGLSRRLDEAARLGFTSAWVPPRSVAEGNRELGIVEVPDIRALAEAL